jgi:hypothetical protein
MLIDVAQGEHTRRRRQLLRSGQWALAIGLTTIFLANAVGAVTDPGSYRHILETSAVTRWIGLAERPWAVFLIAVNDAVIAGALVVALALRRGFSLVAGVAGLWLAVAAVLKVTASFGT